MRASRFVPWIPSVLLSLFVAGFVAGLVTGCGDEDPAAPGAGSISVLVSPVAANGSWTLTGPGGFELEASGDTTLTSMSSGTYTMVWASSALWSAPLPTTVAQTLAGGGSLSFIAVYRARQGTIIVEVEPDHLDAPWRLIGPDRFDESGRGDAALLDLAVGEYSLTWGSVTGWLRPAPNPVTRRLGDEDVLLLDGAYVEVVDPSEPNDALSDEYFVGGPLRDPAEGTNVLEVTTGLLGLGNDIDFHGFTAFAGTPIAVRVDPVSAHGYPVNGQNLDLRLWRRISAAEGTWEILAQTSANAAGLAEYLPPTTYQLAGYLAVEVYATGTRSSVQPYLLRIANVALDAP